MNAVLTLVLQFLDALPLLLAGYEDVKAAAAALSAQIKTMQAEDRDPTDEEWSALDAQVATLMSTIDGAQDPAQPQLLPEG